MSTDEVSSSSTSNNDNSSNSNNNAKRSKSSNKKTLEAIREYDQIDQRGRQNMLPLTKCFGVKSYLHEFYDQNSPYNTNVDYFALRQQ